MMMICLNAQERETLLRKVCKRPERYEQIMGIDEKIIATIDCIDGETEDDYKYIQIGWSPELKFDRLNKSERRHLEEAGFEPMRQDGEYFLFLREKKGRTCYIELEDRRITYKTVGGPFASGVRALVVFSRLTVLEMYTEWKDQAALAIGLAAELLLDRGIVPREVTECNGWLTAWAMLANELVTKYESRPEDPVLDNDEPDNEEAEEEEVDP